MNVTRQEFDKVVEAVWSELEYQNSLPRRTNDEAKDVPGFLTLLRVYIRQVEEDWANNPGTVTPENGTQVEAALHGLRKLAAIASRSMIYNGVRRRK